MGPMAIRFHCAACSQPIEVDDEWASKLVGCPYCRKTITAPAASTLYDAAPIPTATPLSLGGGHVGEAAISYGAAAPSSNSAAVVSFLCACLTVALLFASAVAVAPLSRDLARFQEERGRPVTDNTPQWQVLMEYVESHGGKLPSRLIILGFLELAALACGLTALVCGILGLRGAVRRSLAAAALVILGCVVSLIVIGTAVSFSALAAV